MQKKPNILIIHTDQQSSWTLGCYGGTLIETPYIDSLAEQGMKLNHFYTNCAVCTPSRGCFATGRYPTFHGAYKNILALNSDEITFAEILSKQGYLTGYSGKWHLNGTDFPGWMTPQNSRGFQDCRYMFNRGHHKQIIEQPNSVPQVSMNIGNEETYMTDFLAAKTVDFLSQSMDQPFCYMVSIPDPHTPFSVRAPYDTMYDPADMPVPSTFTEETLPDWALWEEDGRRYTKKGFPIDDPAREERLRREMAQYCGMVKCIDDNVGKILTAVEEQGLSENTIVVFTTDHGEYLGEHGLTGKNKLYETAYRIPMLIRWPEHIQPGSQLDSFVTTVDFQTTLLGLLGIGACGREQGRDASSLLLGKDLDEPWQNQAFIHPNIDLHTGVFTEKYELAYVGTSRNGDQEFKDHILFDRVKDPQQINNVFADPHYQAVVKELTEKIVDHHNELGTDPSMLPREIQKKLSRNSSV